MAARIDDMTFHCWKCGWEWGRAGQPGRSETCPQCQSDLRVCLNCISHDPNAAYQCRDRRAEPDTDKHVGTFCEFFEFAQRTYVPQPEQDARESKARDELRKLLG